MTGYGLMWCDGHVLGSLGAQTVAGWSVWADMVLGRYSAGRDRWRVKRAAGGMSEDHDRCFSTLVLGAFSTPMHYPALTLAPTCGVNRAS